MAWVVREASEPMQFRFRLEHCWSTVRLVPSLYWRVGCHRVEHLGVPSPSEGVRGAVLWDFNCFAGLSAPDAVDLPHQAVHSQPSSSVVLR